MVSIVPEISGGKRHFVNQSMDYARKIWTEMGFKEMTGNMVISSFWNFDALFTPQDHPVREMQDTFFINKSSELSNKKIIEKVRKSHETGVAGSKGWQYKWNEEIAKKMLLRTHTTCLSSQTLTKIKPENLPAKFFAVGRCFRNETMDWSHGFEFNQTEGIVIDPDANFRHLLGYLTQFYKKMGFEKIRVRPSFFPYTEPSLEIDAWQPEKKIWLEIGGAGIFRPEVTEPLLGKAIPVLAWGPGFDRMIMNIFGIKDMREVYKNDLTQLRKLKFLVK
jgi:phenylalanyl-tRNA synthetase alpha chain